MKTGTLGIFDVDSNYANSLMEYISDKRGIPFKTMAFTRVEALKEFTDKNVLDILLISGAAMNEEIGKYDIGKIVLLTEGKVFAEYIGYSTIYKYQSTENIIREVINYYADLSDGEGMVSVTDRKVNVIGVYSPARRTGKTTFSITLGEVLAQKETTLYINMEEFSALNKLFNKEFGGDLADLMYFYKQNPESLPLKLKAIVENVSELDFVPPLMYSEDLRNIEADTWIGLFDAIASSGLYDNIVLDLSNMVKDIFKVLDYCNLIYMPVDKDNASVLRINEFEEYLLKTDREELLEKIVKIDVPIRNENILEPNYLENQLWGNLGDYIRTLVDEELD